MQNYEEQPSSEPTGGADPGPPPPGSLSAGSPQRSRAGARPTRPPRTRTSAAFKGFVGGAVVLLLLLIFILENTQSAKISYFGATGKVALGVALLLAAVGGALLVAIVGAARISQLRKHAKRHN
jgi:uncharacterized integral membrane protein